MFPTLLNVNNKMTKLWLNDFISTKPSAPNIYWKPKSKPAPKTLTLETNTIKIEISKYMLIMFYTKSYIYLEIVSYFDDWRHFNNCH